MTAGIQNRTFSSAEPQTPARFRVVITTYERSQELLDLLRDIDAYRGGHHVSVGVYDDASRDPYTAPRELLSARGWQYVRARQNHGKAAHWKWVGQIYRDQRGRSEPLFVLLPDDVRLCANFFDRALDTWRAIGDPRKCVLQILRDTGRDQKACWTPARPVDAGEFLKIGWTDGFALCNRRYFDLLGWNVDRIPKHWDGKAALGSGVGMVISQRLFGKRAGMYCVKRSLIVHGKDSHMNPTARAKEPLRALRFVDGEAIHDGLLSHQGIHVSLASIPSRRALLEDVVDALYFQCDRLRIYLNGYSRVPSFLDRPRLDVARSQDHGDLGDAGKFFWASKIRGYHLTVDDDIAYPSDYVQMMTRSVERYGRKAIIGLHGVILPQRIGPSYYDNRSVYPCMGSLGSDIPVHVLGTGVVAYHHTTVQLSASCFQVPNMADIWLAIQSKRQRVPMVCVAHEKGWVDHLLDPHPELSIYHRRQEHDHVQAQQLQNAEPWTSPLPLPSTARPTKKARQKSRKQPSPPVPWHSQSSVRVTDGRNTGVKKVR